MDGSTMITGLLLAAAAPAIVPAPPSQLAPALVVQQQPQNMLTLPANTEILLSLNDNLTSKNAKEGDTFALSVVHDVLLNGYVVIPRGSRGVGEVVWRTGKGAFGKSGKMDVVLRYVEIGGQRLSIDGKFRQEGDGNTVATVGTVVLAGLFAGFVTGKTATIPRGRELMAHTREALPVMIAAPPPPPAALPPVIPAALPVAQPNAIISMR